MGTAVVDVPAVPPPSRELMAAVMAVVGARRGDVVLEVEPLTVFTRGLAAAVGHTGRVLVVGVVDLTAPGVVIPVTGLAEVPGGSVSRALLMGHDRTARELVPLLEQVLPTIQGGGRVVVTSRPSNGSLADGLPAVLASLGMRVVHAEGIGQGEERVALASALP